MEFNITFCDTCVFGSSDTDTRVWAVVISKKVLHISETVKKAPSAVERGQWRSWSTKIGAQNVFGVRYAIGIIDIADAEPRPSHNSGIGYILSTFLKCTL